MTPNETTHECERAPTEAAIKQVAIKFSTDLQTWRCRCVHILVSTYILNSINSVPFLRPKKEIVTVNGLGTNALHSVFLIHPSIHIATHAAVLVIMCSTCSPVSLLGGGGGGGAGLYKCVHL